MRRRWLTITQLARVMRHTYGCLQARDHARASLEEGRPIRCVEAHPPTWEDHEAARQRWFARVQPPTKKTHALAGGRWNGTGLMKGKNGRRHKPYGVNPPKSMRQEVMKKKRLPRPIHTHNKQRNEGKELLGGRYHGH